MNIRETLAAIVARLSSIQKIGEDYIKSEENERNRQQERENVPIEVTGTFRLPEAVETQRATDQKRYHTTQKVIAVAAWAAFVAALAYAVVAQLQLREMRTQTAQLYRQAEVENASASRRTAETFQQLEIAQKQANAATNQAIAASTAARAAQRQAEIAEETLQSQERPWVGLDHVNVPNKVVVGSTVSNTLVLRNWGKGPALHLMSQYQMKPICGPFPIRPTYEAKDEGTPIALMPGQPTETAPTYFDKPLTDEAINFLKEPGCNLYVYARITYRDFAKKEHWRHICGRWVKESENSFLVCSTYNDGDEDYKDGKEP